MFGFILEILKTLFKDAIELVAYYYKRAEKAGELDNPEIGDWVKRVSGLEEVAKVESGIILYHVGAIDFSGNSGRSNDFFSERLQVTDDFEVAVSPEALSSYYAHLVSLPSSKRANLYKFQVDNLIFGKLYFVPEDVMIGMVGYDLIPHMERTRKVRDRLRVVRTSHPNLG